MPTAPPAEASLILAPTSVQAQRSPSTSKTVDAMEKAAKGDQAHPLVRAFAGRAIAAADAAARSAGRSEATVLDVVKAIEAQATDEVRFVRDPVNVELLQTPSYLLSLPHRNLGEPMGDCDELATLVASALMSVGLDPSFVRLAWRKGPADPYAHVLVQVPVVLNGRAVPLLLDPSYRGRLEGLVDRAALAHVHRPVSQSRHRSEPRP